MNINTSAAVAGLSRFSHAVLVVPDADGYPLSVATDFRVENGAISLGEVSTGRGPLPDEVEAQLIFSRIRPRPGYGYDQRAYVELAGTLSTEAARWTFTPVSARGWGEDSVPFLELCERALPQARRYLALLGRERGQQVHPRMSLGWRFFLATRLPFLTATLVPVFLGIAAAGLDHHFSWWLALLTLVGAISIHLGLNVANDFFDARSGADEVNVTPTMFSGGSRVIQYGLVSERQMLAIAAACYAVAVSIGVALTAITGIGLLWLGVAGVLISWFYTAPPLRLVHRGLGELAVALGFGPIMVLGAYFVQTGHYGWRPAILSIPVALLVMLILYANEIPDRIADARVGKRTLVVRLSPRIVLRGYALAATLAYAALIAGVAARVLPPPTLVALLTVPLAWRTLQGLREHYDDPYEVMPSLQNNVLLHLATGLLLVAGTLIGLVGS
jgi:1,4-dihydroxy-2-naphthoate polyprenyltransferase